MSARSEVRRHGEPGVVQSVRMMAGFLRALTYSR